MLTSEAKEYIIMHWEVIEKFIESKLTSFYPARSVNGVKSNPNFTLTKVDSKLKPNLSSI